MLARFGYCYNAYAPELIELFLVAAVAAVLGIRAFLALAGYPQIGGDGLHIAHMLWGGLFMLLAVLLFFTVLGRPAQRFSAVLGGVGFGTFIDELGKFITSDNNYFYEPTIGLIYIVFIAIFLVLRAARARTELDPDTAQANALSLLCGSQGGRSSAGDAAEARRLLDRADPTSPLVRALKSYVSGTEASAATDPGIYFKMRVALARQYSRLVLHRWFSPALLALFAIYAFGQIALAILLIVASVINGAYLETLLAQELQLSFTLAARLASSLVEAMLITWGIWKLRYSRLTAYRWFSRAMLVSIFITQVFAFLETQFAALGALAGSILIYTALRYMIEQESRTTTAF